ncbi:MAG TPA: LytR family transcriptional regulator, partial [Marmoricola sp.]|nr:LytR family transcriptional regulator [Marmoricola sp.]
MPKPPQQSPGQADPEFEWLYGARPGPNRSTPESTRIISRDDLREYQRTGRKPRPAAQPNQPGRPRRRIPLLRIVIGLLALWLVFLVVVPIMAWSRINRVDISTANQIGDQPGTNYLLVGSDSRRGLSRKENKRLGTGGVGDVGQRTDTIMILHTGSGKPVLMSIPRYSLVPIPGHGTSKINAAFA